jgi:hypothetical protein
MVEMYVIAPEKKAEGFTNQLAGMIDHFGMSAYVSHMPNFDGSPFHILEGHGKWLRLWSQNMPLDPNIPMQRCGPQISADPGQYALMISRIIPFGTEKAAKEFSLRLASELRAAGYEVHSKPVICSPWLKDRTAH